MVHYRITVLFVEMYVRVVFVIGRVYSAMSLVREERFIRIVYYYCIHRAPLKKLFIQNQQYLLEHPLRSHKIFI